MTIRFFAQRDFRGFMGFDNHYQNRKDRRKPYRDSRRFDRTCRNHGSCPWCERRRLFERTKKERFAELDLKEYDNQGDV